MVGPGEHSRGTKNVQADRTRNARNAPLAPTIVLLCVGGSRFGAKIQFFCLPLTHYDFHDILIKLLFRNKSFWMLSRMSIVGSQSYSVSSCVCVAHGREELSLFAFRTATVSRFS